MPPRDPDALKRGIQDGRQDGYWKPYRVEGRPLRYLVGYLWGIWTYGNDLKDFDQDDDDEWSRW